LWCTLQSNYYCPFDVADVQKLFSNKFVCVIGDSGTYDGTTYDDDAAICPVC